MNPAPMLIFDADCAFCRASVVWGQRHLDWFPESIGFQFLQPADFALTEQQVRKSIWMVGQNGAKTIRLPAGRAACFILKQQTNPGWRALGFFADLPVLRLATKAAYYLVAANRQRLPGGTAECELPKATSETT